MQYMAEKNHRQGFDRLLMVSKNQTGRGWRDLLREHVQLEELRDEFDVAHPPLAVPRFHAVPLGRVRWQLGQPLERSGQEGRDKP